MTQSSLKVLFLTSSYPRSEQDAASIFLRYLAEHLTELGVAVHVLAPAAEHGGTSVENKIVVHRFRYFPKSWQTLAYHSGIVPNLRRSPWLWLQVPFFLIAMAGTLLRLLYEERFDLIHAHWILPQGLPALLANMLFRVPVVVTAHGTDAFALRGKFATLLKHFIIQRSARWTANTRETARALAAHSKAPEPKIIPMGVDKALFAQGKPDLLRRDVDENETVLLFVGRLIEQKGCYNLLHAMSLLSPVIRGRIRLWVIGDGDQKAPLQKSAVTFGIRERVTFFGALSHHCLPDFYAAADIVVVPSSDGNSGATEGQSVVVLEAFAAQTCVLATRVGGISSMVRDGITGVLVEPNSPSALGQALELLLSNPGLRARLAATGFVELKACYSWSHIAEEFVQIYRQVSCSSDPLIANCHK